MPTGCLSASRCSRCAFTLVELLVVTSLIGLLMALLLPSLSKARESARKTQCATNLRSLGSTLFIYMADNTDTIPLEDLLYSQHRWYDGNPGEFMRMLTQWGSVTFPQVVMKPLPIPELLNCPSTPPYLEKWDGFSTRYSWFANNYGSSNMRADSLSTYRPFPKLRMMNLEALYDWKKNPVILAMDRIDALDNPAALSYPFGVGYTQFWFKTNHWIDASNAAIKNYDGANILVHDGSVKWYSWGTGADWFQARNHARPFATTFFTTQGNAGLLSSNDGVGSNGVGCYSNNMATNTLNQLGAMTTAQYQALKRVLKYN